VLHDDAVDLGLEVVPFAVVLGEGNVIGALKYSCESRHGEQRFG
jgi:hypothetical protein